MSKNYDLKTWATTPFQSQDEMVDAMRDPRYSHPILGTEYRQAVESKLALPSGPELGLKGTQKGGVYRHTLELGVTRYGPNGERDLVAAQEAKDDYAATREAYGRLMGPQAIGPVDPIGPARIVDHGAKEV